MLCAKGEKRIKCFKKSHAKKSFVVVDVNSNVVATVLSLRGHEVVIGRRHLRMWIVRRMLRRLGLPRQAVVTVAVIVMRLLRQRRRSARLRR